MATSQSLVARAVPRALDPYSTTASMPGIEPTASAAVRRRRSCVVVVIGMSPRTGPRHRNVRSWAAHAASPAWQGDDLAVGRRNRGAADSALHPPVNGQVIAINLTPAPCGCAASRGLGERGASGPGPRQWAGSGHGERARGCGVEPARVRRRCPCATSAAVFTSGEVGENRLDEFGSRDASDDAQSCASCRVRNSMSFH